MVVNNIHDDSDAIIVQRLNHGLQLHDAVDRIRWLGCVGAFWNVEVLRVIAPVECWLSFDNRSVVIDRQELNVADAHFLYCRNTRRVLGLDDSLLLGLLVHDHLSGCGVVIGKGQELASVSYWDAAVRVNRQIANVGLIDDGVGWLAREGRFVGGTRSPSSWVGAA